jgi:hypothetical protein
VIKVGDTGSGRGTGSGLYLRQQVEILIAISRATFDLAVARRLREVAPELQARAAEQDAECTFAASEANFKRPVGT